MSGPQKQPLDWEKLDAILQFGPTRQMCADILGISIETLKRRIKEEHDTTFTEYADQKFAKTKLKLIQKAITMGLGGNATMLIFSLKNKCNWKDNPDGVDERIDGMEF